METQSKIAHADHSAHDKHYKKLLFMALLSFLCMYVLMYAMVNSISNVIPNINQFYMAGLMTMPMIIIELIVMRGMYANKKLNFVIIGISMVCLVSFFFMIRFQTGVSDKQFLKSMIPHHAGALLMCKTADIHDPEIVELCKSIKSGQQSEIDQMNNILTRLK